MMKKHAYLVPVFILVMAILACNLQSAGTGANPGAAATAVAQTVTALAQLPAHGNSATDTPVTATAIPVTDTVPPASPAIPTDTPIMAATQICDNAQFISETVPDGTLENPGVAFVKTWRLKNIGACTWTSSYNVVFVNGDAMGASSAVPLLGNIAPGQEVDVTVNMVAPLTPGNYSGTWTMRNASGVIFGLGAANGPFWIKITVPAPTATPTATSSGPLIHVPHVPLVPLVPILFQPSVSQVLNPASIPAFGTGYAVATCPSGSIVTGGGFAGSSSLLVYSSFSSTNGWKAAAKNLSASPLTLNAYAECLSNTTGTTQQVYSQTTAPASGMGHVVINCPSGRVITGGGFVSNPHLLVFSNSATGNGWEVDVQNQSSSSQLVNAYAICLSGTSGSTQQVVNQVNVAGSSNGNSIKACPATTLLTGGGYAGNSNLIVFSDAATSSGWQVFAHNISGTSQLLNSYAVCLTLP